MSVDMDMFTPPPSAKIFNWHKLVKVGGTYYDPSYGLGFPDLILTREAYTQAAIGAGMYRLELEGEDVYCWGEIQDDMGRLYDGPIQLAP